MRKINEEFKSDNGEFDNESYFWTDDNAYPFVYFLLEDKLIFGSKGTNHLNIYCNKINGCDTSVLNQNQFRLFFDMILQQRKRNFEGRVWNLKNRNDLIYDLVISFWDGGTHTEISKEICKRFNVEETKCVIVDKESNGYLLSGGKPFRKTDRVLQEIIRKEILNLLYEDENNIGYHYGDLGKCDMDGLYSSSPSRNTGHFGTGTYFFGKYGDTKYGKTFGYDRPRHEVNFDNYNVLKLHSNEDALLLHDFLRELNTFYCPYPIENPTTVEEYRKKHFQLKKIGSYLSDAAIFHIYEPNKNAFKVKLEKFKKLAKSLEYDGYRHSPLLSYRDRLNKIIEKNNDPYDLIFEILYYFKENDFTKVIRLFEEFPKLNGEWWKIPHILNKPYEEIVNAIYAARDYYYSHDAKRDIKNFPNHMDFRRIDSPSTFFIKYLGYDGIDVRELDMVDNSMYGSVIYDLNK